MVRWLLIIKDLGMCTYPLDATHPLDAAHRIDPSIFGFISTWPPWWCHVHHPRRTYTSLEARPGNPSPTCFQAKQAARSQRMSRAVFILPLVLWRNQQTIAHLVLRPKPKNYRGDFAGQITKPQLPVLRPKLGNPSGWFWRQTTKP
jgi:hypothetical protein